MPDLRSLDADGDGRLSMAEAPEQLKPMFDRMDRNGDGFISQGEFQGGRGAGRGQRPR